MSIFLSRQVWSHREILISFWNMPHSERVPFIGSTWTERKKLFLFQYSRKLCCRWDAATVILHITILTRAILQLTMNKHRDAMRFTPQFGESVQPRINKNERFRWSSAWNLSLQPTKIRPSSEVAQKRFQKIIQSEAECFLLQKVYLCRTKLELCK